MSCSLPSRDSELVQITDSALAETTRKSGNWLVCRPGCTQCCIGPFAINQLDVVRLRQGLAGLEQSDPQRASRVRERAKHSVTRLTQLPGGFPGDLATGILDEGEDAERRFDHFTNLPANAPFPLPTPVTATT